MNSEHARNLTGTPDRSSSALARVDPAAVKAAHQPWYLEPQWCRTCEGGQKPWPCEPYLLAVEVERLAQEADDLDEEGELTAAARDRWRARAQKAESEVERLAGIVACVEAELLRGGQTADFRCRVALAILTGRG